MHLCIQRWRQFTRTIDFDSYQSINIILSFATSRAIERQWLFFGLFSPLFTFQPIQIRSNFLDSVLLFIINVFTLISHRCNIRTKPNVSTHKKRKKSWSCFQWIDSNENATTLGGIHIPLYQWWVFSMKKFRGWKKRHNRNNKIRRQLF